MFELIQAAELKLIIFASSKITFISSSSLFTTVPTPNTPCFTVEPISNAFLAFLLFSAFIAFSSFLLSKSFDILLKLEAYFFLLSFLFLGFITFSLFLALLSGLLLSPFKSSFASENITLSISVLGFTLPLSL